MWIVVDLESSLDGIDGGLGLVFEEFVNGEVAGHYELLMLQVELVAFGLGLACVLVCPDFHMVRESIGVTVVKNDNFFTLVTVKPFVLGLDVGVWVSMSYIVRLAGTWDSPVPLSSNCGMLIRRFSK